MVFIAPVERNDTVEFLAKKPDNKYNYRAFNADNAFVLGFTWFIYR